MRDNNLFSEALTVACSKSIPIAVEAQERFRPRANYLYVRNDWPICYIYFTEYSNNKLIGWLLDATNRRIECSIIISSGAECWFGNIAGQRLIDSDNIVENIIVTDTPECQRVCVRPADMLKALNGEELILAS